MSTPLPTSNPSRKKALRRQIPESLLARLWRERAVRQQNLKTTEGRHVRILYPGRRGTEAGPDFRDALIYREGMGLVRGDVELHLKPQDWDHHGHASDHRYNSVVLHGVLSPPDSPQPLPGGGAAPAVELGPLLDPVPDHPARTRDVLWAILQSHGYPKPATRREALQLLSRAGKARFINKSEALIPLVSEIGPQEALYQALMESLGYSENRLGFLELAQHVPYKAILQALSSAFGQDRAPLIQRVLLEAAGFHKPEGEVLSASPAIDRRRWRLFRIRPANHPRRRIAGAAILLQRTEATGLVESVEGWVRSGSFKAILQNLVAADPSGGPAFIGRARALEIAINVVLPFLHAHGLQRKDEALAQEYTNLFMAGPRPQPNRITREMEDVLFPKPWRPLGGTAARQQGLTHFHRLIQGEE